VRLLMVSGDRQVVLGERGPFFSMQREFSRHFERIDVLCPRPSRPPSVLSIHERVHFHPADVPRARAAQWIVKTGRALIAEHHHGLIVSHDYGWFRNGIGSARLSRRTGVPYLSEIHHVPGHPFAAGWRERFEKSLARRYVRWALDRAAAFRVVNSGEMPDLLASWGVPREKILVLPSLYIDLAVFRPDPGERGFDQDLVFVGRMVENKGLDRIVDALAELASRGQRFTVLFVGKGPLLEPTRERVRRRGISEAARFVEWVDSPEELARIYRRSRLVVCASSCEGGPRFTVEAMACGTPAVSTAVGVMGDLLSDGSCGRLAGFSAGSLSEAIESVLADEDRRRSMGEKARAVASRFEYASTIRGYAEGLKRLAERAGVDRRGGDAA
jgi:glycosyltransferase involved in cell wall biosynthesis